MRGIIFNLKNTCKIHGEEWPTFCCFFKSIDTVWEGIFLNSSGQVKETGNWYGQVI